MTLLILILATWRITSLLNREQGPYNVLGKLRYTIGIRVDDAGQTYGITELARLVDCPWCLSLWVGAGLALVTATGVRDWALTTLALSAGAVLIDEVWKRVTS